MAQSKCTPGKYAAAARAVACYVQQDDTAHHPRSLPKHALGNVRRVSSVLREPRCATKHAQRVLIKPVSRECIRCSIGKYSFDSLNDEECVVCPRGADCLGGADVRTRKGYWRSVKNDYLLCYTEGVCVGGVGNSTCAEGHGGPFCGLCIEGWEPGSGGMCVAPDECGSFNS